MSKKKLNPSQRKPAREKQLRLVDHSPVGLTDEQQQELRRLYRSLAQNLSPPWDDVEGQRRLGLARYLYLYVEFLCYDAMLETGKVRK